MRLVAAGGLDDDAGVAARLRELTARMQQHGQRLYTLAAQEAAQPPQPDADEIRGDESLQHVIRSSDVTEARSALRGFITSVVVRGDNVVISFKLPKPARVLPPVMESLISPTGPEGLLYSDENF